MKRCPQVGVEKLKLNFYRSTHFKNTRNRIAKLLLLHSEVQRNCSTSVPSQDLPRSLPPQGCRGKLNVNPSWEAQSDNPLDIPLRKLSLCLDNTGSRSVSLSHSLPQPSSSLRRVGVRTGDMALVNLRQRKETMRPDLRGRLRVPTGLCRSLVAPWSEPLLA